MLERKNVVQKSSPPGKEVGHPAQGKCALVQPLQLTKTDLASDTASGLEPDSASDMVSGSPSVAPSGLGAGSASDTGQDSEVDLASDEASVSRGPGSMAADSHRTEPFVELCRSLGATTLLAVSREKER